MPTRPFFLQDSGGDNTGGVPPLTGNTTQYVGPSSPTFADNEQPFNHYYRNSVCAIIITATELGGAKQIQRLEYQLAYNWSTNLLMNNQEIYLMHTTANSFPSGFTNKDMTGLPGLANKLKVYDGGVYTLSGNGGTWKGVDFTTNFVYNGTDNLCILWQNKYNIYSSTYPFFRETITTGTSQGQNPYNYMGFEGRSDSAFSAISASRISTRFDCRLKY